MAEKHAVGCFDVRVIGFKNNYLEKQDREMFLKAVVFKNLATLTINKNSLNYFILICTNEWRS